MNDDTDAASSAPPVAASQPQPARKSSSKPALHVICLGDSGGPSEENVTAFLVRSTASAWAKGSLLAVDAGVHLAPIVRIVERDFPIAVQKAEEERSENGHKTPGLSGSFARASLSPEPEDSDAEESKPVPTVMTEGPFAGMRMPHASAKANAMHVLQMYVSAYLITHPHLDHMSGFAINTAAMNAGTLPKTLAALPGTVDAMKRHIFNDIIWPNLTDEDGGVGFVTFQRLKEGGDSMLGEGEGRGYINVCDGLGAKAFKVSHGKCTAINTSHRHRGSVTSLSDPHNGSIGVSGPQGMSRSLSMTQHPQFSAPGTPGPTPRQSYYSTQQPSPRMAPQDSSCIVDSTAYFLRDSETEHEVLFFGDVEPDSISETDRNYTVWTEAARKIALGRLSGIFIECSYDDSQPDQYLFGHMNPKHLVAELATLAHLTREAKQQRAAELQHVKKRKRSGPNGVENAARHAMSGETESKRSRSLAHQLGDENYRRRSGQDANMLDATPGPPSPATEYPPHFIVTDDGKGHDTPMSPMSVQPLHQHSHSTHYNRDTHPHLGPNGLSKSSALGESQVHGDHPLAGLRVFVIHVKDTFKDGPHVSVKILEELNEHEARLEEKGMSLGCEFVISKSGESYWF